MLIILYVSLLILFTSTFIQGHDNFDANTTDDTLSSSSSELESGRRCGSHKSKKDVDRDEAEHEKCDELPVIPRIHRVLAYLF